MIGSAPDDTSLWSVAAARVVSSVLGVGALVANAARRGERPGPRAAAFAIAAAAGDLAVTAALAALYPAVTAGLAQATPGARPGRVQAIGAAALVVGVVIVAGGAATTTATPEGQTRRPGFARAGQRGRARADLVSPHDAARSAKRPLASRRRTTPPLPRERRVVSVARRACLDMHARAPAHGVGRPGLTAHVGRMAPRPGRGASNTGVGGVLGRRRHRHS